MRTQYNLFDLVDSIFDFNPSNKMFRRAWSSPCRYVYDSRLKKADEDGKVYTLDLPGQSKEDVKVTFKEGERLLSIEAKDYSHSWTLPQHMVIEDAEMLHGRLTLKFKEDLPPEAEPKLIELK